MRPGSSSNRPNDAPGPVLIASRGMGHPRSGRRSTLLATVVVGALALVYLAVFALQSLGATEGSVPPASSIPLPTGSTILAEEKACASGGCWTALEVRPPAGMTPEELAADIGATPQLRMPGTFLNPLTVWLWAEPRGGVLLVRADYWSSEWVP